jgi:predicted small secreted protein
MAPRANPIRQAEARASLSVTDPGTARQKVKTMCKRTTILTLTLLALLGAAPILGACHTTAGAGEDISKTGSAIENSANRAAP